MSYVLHRRTSIFTMWEEGLALKISSHRPWHWLNLFKTDRKTNPIFRGGKKTSKNFTIYIYVNKQRTLIIQTKTFFYSIFIKINQHPMNEFLLCNKKIRSKKVAKMAIHALHKKCTSTDFPMQKSGTTRGCWPDLIIFPRVEKDQWPSSW